jgi:dynein intermediate chain 2, axonemal
MEVVYVYQRKRREFGKQPLFADKPADLSCSITPDASYMKNYVERNPCHLEIQASAEKSEHEVNTETASFTNRGILHSQVL